MLLSMVLYIVLILITGQILIRILAKVFPFPCPYEVAWLLESPLRQHMFSRKRNLERIGIKPGETIFELGPGPGFFTLEAARRIGPEGGLYCLDIQLKMIQRIRKKAVEHGALHIWCALGDVVQLPYEDNSFYRAFLITVLGEIRERETALKELFRVLKHEGTLSVTELLLDPHYMTRRRSRTVCQQAGFQFSAIHGNIFEYTLNVTK